MRKDVAFIRESDCIGCTKCIDACPVDAILGSAKSMHTVITDECISCKLCIPPCPVNCIDMVALPNIAPRIPPEQVKQRYRARKERLQANATVISPITTNKQHYILAALQRAAAKKQSS